MLMAASTAAGPVSNNKKHKMSTTEFSTNNINEYFSNLNPIATKVSLDIENTKSIYEHIWNTLNNREQIDIINETLIKPEISLRYFDNFSSSSSSSSSESSSVSLIDGSKNVKRNQQQDLKTKLIYQFDGKNLSTFHQQKIATKKIHDEQIGLYRDEHSAPFSFKTKSQLNLKLFDSKSSCNDDHVDMSKVSASTIMKFRKLNDELAANLKIKVESLTEHQDLNKFNGKLDGKYERLQNDALNYDEQSGKSTNFLSKFMTKNSLLFTSGPKPIIVPGVNDFEAEDMVLMNNISYSGSGLTSSTSGEESIDDEEKTVCEDSKLLLVDNSDALRKGFDFLANW